MSFNNIAKLTMVSAVALGFVAYTGAAHAFEMDDDVLTVTVTADVDNTVAFAVTPLQFQTIGVTSDGVDVATLVMTPAGAITDDLGAGIGGAGEAHIVSDDNTGSPAVASLTAALPNSSVFVYYSNFVNLTDGSLPNLILEQVADNLATPGSYTTSTATSVTGIGVTTPGGILTWNIGGSIQTVATALPYETNTYTGSFDIILTY